MRLAELARRPRLRLGIDLDGVLANFTERFIEITNATYGLNLRTEDQTDWGHTCLGITPAQEEEIWQTIKATKNFWETLNVLPGTENLNRAAHEHELFFITSRIPTAGLDVKTQSAFWLDEHFYIPYPSVIVVTDWKDKPALYDALKLDGFIDDKPETVDEMLKRNQRIYIMDQPYNKLVEAPRVKSVNEFLERVENVEEDQDTAH
jgi:uncharacterized HAD superfamily protein